MPWLPLGTPSEGAHLKSPQRDRACRLLPAFVISLLIAITSTSIAEAGTSTACSFDDASGIATVTVTHGVVATISRDGDAIAVDGFPCQTATVTNTDVIEVGLPPASQAETVVVDLSGGPLAPGVTDEGDGLSEIELHVDGVDDDSDTLRVVGSTGADEIAIHTASANLNANEQVADDDVTIDIPTSIQLLGGEGDDLLSLPDLSPGGSFELAELQGGPGEDRLIGGMGASNIDGGPGRDIVDYSWVPGSVTLIWETDDAFVLQRPRRGRLGERRGRDPHRRSRHGCLSRRRERRDEDGWGFRLGTSSSLIPGRVLPASGSCAQVPETSTRSSSIPMRISRSRWICR